MFRFGQFNSHPNPVVLFSRATLRIVDPMPGQCADWFALPDDAGHVLLPHLPADQDQAPRQGRA